MFQRILVGTDGSPHAQRAADAGAALARCFGAELVVASVASEDTLAAGGWSDAPVPVGVARARAEDEAARLAAVGVDAKVRVLEGRPAAALAKEATAGGFDALVVGEQGSGAVAGADRTGSVPLDLARTSPCALLIVP